MINILFFIDTLRGGGAAKVLTSLVNAMDQSRFAITVQTLYQEDAAALATGITYKYCYRTDDKLHRLIMRVESEMGDLYHKRIRGPYDIECAYLESLSTKIMAASTNTKAVKCAWVHCDIERMAGDISAYAAKTKPWYIAFDQAVCVSRTAKEAFDRVYGGQFQSVVLYNTINDTEIREKAELPLLRVKPDRAITIVSVGTLYPPKNQLRALKAVKQLLAVGLGVSMWLLGEGPDRGKLEQYIAENDLREQVKLLGFVQNPYPHMRQADLLVCSSVYEGFSTFITEGLILGKPIVTTDCSGMHELLGDSEFGLITENDDEAFYQGLKRMLTEPGLLDHYREKAAIRGRDFRQEALVRATEEFFLEEFMKKNMEGRL